MTGSQHGEVHATNELGVGPGHRVEGAVGQHDRAVGGCGAYPHSVSASQVQARSRSRLLWGQRLLGLGLRRRLLFPSTLPIVGNVSSP
jgi:hypothetical protein